MTLDELLETVASVDAHLDVAVPPVYKEQPLARTWARVTKVLSEGAEAMDELSAITGENFRKGVHSTEDHLCAELGDCVTASLGALFHLLKDPDQVWEYVCRSAVKGRARVETDMR